jgi:hypothetical protein
MATIFFLTPLNTYLCTQSADKTHKEPLAELKLMWEKKFEQPISGYFVDLDSQEGVSLRTVYFTGSGETKFRFFDRNGEEIKSEILQLTKGGGLLQSQDGEYIGIYEITKGKPEYIEESAFSLYNKDGLLLWKHPGIKGQPFSILNTGAVLWSENPYGWDMFTLRDGDRVLARISPGDVEEGTGAFATSRNSRLVYNVLNKQGGTIALYDATGSELWQQRFNWKWTGSVEISDYGKYIVAIGQPSESRLHMFSSIGSLLWEFQSKNCELMDFSPDEEYLAAAINLHNLHLFESATGEIIWKYSLDATRSFFSIAVANEGEFVVATAGQGRRELPAGTQSTIFLFARKGRVAWRKEMNIKNGCAPQVRLTHKGQFLLVCNSEELICYEIISTNKINEESWGKQGKFVLRTLDTIAIFAQHDSIDHIANIEENTDLELLEIYGDNDWIRVCKNSMCGWMRVDNVRLDASFVAGYRLFLSLWSTSPDDFERNTGYTIECIELSEGEKSSKQHLFPGLYLKQVFKSTDEAKVVGDSLVERKLLDEDAATGLYYRIIPVFKPEYPHLYLGVAGGIEFTKLLCPVCGKILSDPSVKQELPRNPTYRELVDSMQWTHRFTDQGFEIYQCINGHLVAVFRESWD